jgi:hypothetical protein
LCLETLGSTGARSEREVPNSTYDFANFGQVIKQKLFGASAKGNHPRWLDDIDFAPEEIEMEVEIRWQCLTTLTTLAAPLDDIRKVSIRHSELDESPI